MKVKQSPGLLCKVALGLSGLRGSSDCQGAKFAQSLINLLFSTHPNSAHALTSPLQKLGAAPEQAGGAQSDIQRVPEIFPIPPGAAADTPGLEKTLICRGFLRLLT